MNTRLSFLVAGLFVILFSCSKNSSDTGPAPESPGAFDKSAMLANYADNIIIPAYHHLQEDVDALVIAVNAFADAPSASTQNAAKEAYKRATKKDNLVFILIC